MPSSVRVGSRITSTPGVYTQVDASGLSAPSPTAVGIVALIGEAVGGVPYTAITGREDLTFYPTASALSRAYAAGDLLEGANICFAPSTVTGGAQQVVALKANPSTRASVTLQGTAGPVITLRAQAWGLAGNSLEVSIAAGSTSGTAITITDGRVTESADNLGDDLVAKLSYQPSGGWSTLSVAKDAAALSLSGQAAAAATVGEIAQTTLTAPAPVTITAADGDLGKSLTLYGIDGAGAALAEVVTLSASTQQSAGTFARLLGAFLSDTAEAISLTDATGATLASFAANTQHLGTTAVGSLPVANAPVAVTGQDAGEKALVVGLQASGAPQVQLVTLAAGTPVATAGAFSAVKLVVTGGLSHGLTLAAPAARVPATGATTLRAAAGALRAIPGVNLALTRGDEDTPISGLDALPTTALGAQPLSLVSDVEAVVDWVNANSQLLIAEVIPGAKSQPAPTAQPLQLSGGSESPATAADYSACLDLLKQVRVNLVVPLTSDPAVAAATEAHCSYMSGAGQSERMCHLGAMDPTLQKPASRAAVKAQSAALNSAYATLCPNGILRFDTSGNLTEFAPHFTAAALAGMRAGARVNTPLTRKALSVVGFTQDPSYDPVADSDDLIDAGVTILRRFDALGVCPVRDVTTWTRDNNPLFSASMVAYATGINVYTYRTALERFVGQDEFSGGFNQIQVFAVQVLSELRQAHQIYDFDPPTGSRVGDAIYVDQTWQYDPETNFILPTIHLVNPQLAAA